MEKGEQGSLLKLTVLLFSGLSVPDLAMSENKIILTTFLWNSFEEPFDQKEDSLVFKGRVLQIVWAEGGRQVEPKTAWDNKDSQKHQL